MAPTISSLLEQGVDFCSVEQLGQVLHISRGLAYEGVRNGDIPAVRVGSRWLVPVRRLAALAGAVDGGAE